MSSYIKAGSLISITLDDDSLVKGDVIYHDSISGFLFLQMPAKSGKVDRQDVMMLQMACVKDSKIIKEGTGQQLYPALNLDQIDKRMERNRELCQENFKSVGVGVTQEAQLLFNYIKITYTDTVWNGVDIVVMDSTMIQPPYKQENVVPFKEGQKKESVERIKKTVNRFYEIQSQEATTAPAK